MTVAPHILVEYTGISFLFISHLLLQLRFIMKIYKRFLLHCLYSNKVKLCQIPTLTVPAKLG
jgi:hypothetical protein